MNTKIIKYVFATSRPNFLLLVPACFLLGVATAQIETGEIDWFRILMVLAGALLAHISVNILNEYQDFRSGLDTKTQPTPFSGGSKTLQSHSEAARPALMAALIALVMAFAIGLYITFTVGWMVWIPASIGLLIIIFYTGFINKFPVLCLISPGLGFGSCMVLGTHYSLAGNFTWPAFFASLIPFFLVNNLLLLNQFPDVEADKTVGRRHFPITIGRPASAKIYFAFLIGTFSTIIIAVLFGFLPHGALAGMLMAILAFPLQNGISQNADDLKALTPFMGMNVIMTLMTPVLVAVGIFLTI